MMISWFSSSRIRAYVKLSTKKQNKVKAGIDERYSEQRTILENRLYSARTSARKAHSLLDKGKKDKAKEQINSFKLELASSQPVLNAYVATSLERHLMELMAMDGFEFPDILSEVRADIDYGLFSVNATNELATVLETEVNPFEELGIEI